MSDILEIKRPDDWHLHLRDGPMLREVVPASSRHFARAIVMPNLVPPVTTLASARAYRARILEAVPAGHSFEPLMTLYLTEDTPASEIRAARQSGIVYGVKLYPAGATTHSDAGVRDIRRTHETLGAMAEAGLPLLVHGEVTHPSVDIFDREARFIDEVLAPLVEGFPELRVVLEHVSTEYGTEFVRSRDRNLGATLTPQHLLMNRNELFAGGIRPHNYCLPVLKKERDREALVAAATSGDARFFLGTDSAPHARASKENDCGCAGTYNAPAALAVYARIFESANALSQLEKFASINGPRFYGLPVNTDTLTLRRESWQVPGRESCGPDSPVPWLGGTTLDWQVAGN